VVYFHTWYRIVVICHVKKMDLLLLNVTTERFLRKLADILLWKEVMVQGFIQLIQNMV